MNLKIGHIKSKFNATSAQERVYHKRIWFIIYSDSVMHNLLDRCILYMYIYIVQWIHNYEFHLWSDVKKKSLGSTEPIILQDWNKKRGKHRNILAVFKYLNFIVYCWILKCYDIWNRVVVCWRRAKKKSVEKWPNCLLNNQLSGVMY